MATLPRQGASSSQPWSLTRDSQARTELETALNALLGVGVLSGGKVTKTAAFSVEVASGTVLFAEGVSLTLSAAAAHTVAGSPTIYLWGTITRTAATQSSPTASDTYALTLSHNTTGTAPSSLHFPLATITADAGGISSIDNAPAGKYVRALPNLGRQRLTLSGGTTTLTAAQYRSGILEFAGGGANTVVLPTEAGRRWIVYNALASGTVLVTTADGEGVTVAAGVRQPVYCDGTDIVPGTPTLGDVESDVATLQAELDELARLFRVLLLHLVSEGIDCHPELSDQLSLAAGEA